MSAVRRLALALASTIVVLSGCASGGSLDEAGQASRPIAPTASSIPAATPGTRAPVPAAPGSQSPAPRATVPSAPSSGPTVSLPTPNANFDYQLGGAYPPPSGVSMVSRDRTDPPAPGLYNVCYVNGFQTQPGESQWWLTSHPALVLRDSSNAPVIDPDWPGEYILDISTAPKRAQIAAIVGPWIAGCGSSGYQAVEIDNLDTYTRFSAKLEEADAIAMASAYVGIAHAEGLAIAQKNSAELVALRNQTGFDFAVAEQCGQYDECALYTAGYGNLVYVIEYQQAAFTATCAQYPNLSVLLRDVNLTTPSNTAYRRSAC